MFPINLSHPTTPLKPPFPTCHKPRVQPRSLRLTVKAATAATIDVDLGRPKSSQNTLYRVLGIHPEASKTEIKAAYRSLAKLHHPDVTSSNPDTRNFIQIHNAYATLSDPVARAKYDLSLANETAHRHFGYSTSNSTNTTFRPIRRWETDQCW